MARCPYCKLPVSLEKTQRELAAVVDVVHKEVESWMKKEMRCSRPRCDAVLDFGSFFGGLLTGRPRHRRSARGGCQSAGRANLGQFARWGEFAQGKRQDSYF